MTASEHGIRREAHSAERAAQDARPSARREMPCFAFRVPRSMLPGLMLLALLHGLAYVFIVPIWQAPDEPMLYEYVGLVADLGRVPRFADRNIALEERIVASLTRNHFWNYTAGTVPLEPPQTLAEVYQFFFMPRQVGGDPPLYFVLAALPLRLVPDWSIEQQVTLLRLLNVLLLPLLVACAYGAAWELEGWSGERRVASGEQPPRPNAALPASRSPLPLAVAGLVALHPMLAVVSAALSNDGLANLLGAALCWALLRMLRCGVSPRRLWLTLLLLTLALLTKRTTLPYLLLLVVFGLGWIGTWRVITERRSLAVIAGWRLAASGLPALLLRRLPLTLTVMLLVVLVTAWGARQLDRSTAAFWLAARTEQPAVRTWPSGGTGAALRIGSGEEVIQPLPAVGIHLLQNHKLRYGVHIWSPVAATGRLIVYTGDQRQEFPFEVHDSHDLNMWAFIPPLAPDVRLGLTADSGWFYADNFRATGAGLAGNVLLNGALELPGLRRDSALAVVNSYLRLPEATWVLSSGRLTYAFPYVAWASVLFASFWGHFGWMNVPFVSASLWTPLLALVCLSGLPGTLRWLLGRQSQPWQRRQIAMLLLLLVLAVAMTLINAHATTSALQQGRYLFPVLVPVALLIALGQMALLPAGWQRRWLIGWLGFWSVFAIAALARLVTYYHH